MSSAESLLDFTYNRCKRWGWRRGRKGGRKPNADGEMKYLPLTFPFICSRQRRFRSFCTSVIWLLSWDAANRQVEA